MARVIVRVAAVSPACLAAAAAQGPGHHRDVDATAPCEIPGSACLHDTTQVIIHRHIVSLAAKLLYLFFSISSNSLAQSRMPL